MNEVLESDVPPIVIHFGEGFEDAIPEVIAEAQYYGFRAKALDDPNPITVWAVQNGVVEESWMWGDMESRAEIEQAIIRLEQSIEEFKSAHPDEFAAAEERNRKLEQTEDPDERERLLLEMGVFVEESLGKYSPEDFGAIKRRAEETGARLSSDLEPYYGAIKWLRFWSDKGFKIAADF